MEKTQLKLPKENPFVMRPEEDENIPKEFLGSRRCRSLANITFVNESRPNLSSNIRASTHLGIRVKLFGLENLNLNFIIRLRSTFLNTHLKAFLNPVWRRYQVSAPVLSNIDFLGQEVTADINVFFTLDTTAELKLFYYVFEETS